MNNVVNEVEIINTLIQKINKNVNEYVTASLSNNKKEIDRCNDEARALLIDAKTIFTMLINKKLK